MKHSHLSPAAHSFGLGLRNTHYADFLTGNVPVDFIEVISENFMIPGGRPRHILRQIREKHPVALHGVSMSIGSAGGLDPEYLARLKDLVDEIEPLFVSDHLCWTRTPGFNSHDLLPVPLTKAALDTVCTAVTRAQEVLGRTILIENPSSYVTFAADEMSEWEFLSAVCAKTGCDLLLDVNNIYVTAANHGFDAISYLDGLPVDRVRQIHLAGHTQGKHMLIDTHDQPVPQGVWTIYRAALQRVGPVATMIERDDNIPPLAELLAELDTAREMATWSVPCLV
ncbi:MAG: DUF692 domain-containing protein [Novosphingobium sp.]